jgi:hypothetical protein
MSSKVALSCLNFHLRDEMRANICFLAEALFRKELFVSSISMTLEADYNRASKSIYEVTLLLELRKSEIVACAQANDLMAAITLAISKAEGLLHERFEFLQKDRISA